MRRLTLTIKLADARTIYDITRNTHESNPARFASLQRFRSKLQSRIAFLEKQGGEQQPQQQTTLTA